MTAVVTTMTTTTITNNTNNEYKIKNYDILEFIPEIQRIIEDLVYELNQKTGYISSPHGGGNTKEMTSDLIKMVKEGFIFKKYHGKLFSSYGSRSSYCKFISKVLGLKKHYILIRLKLLRLDIPRIVNLYYSNVIHYFDISMLGNFPPNKQDEILHALLYETNRKDTREKRVEFYKKFTYGNNNSVERKKIFGGKKEEPPITTEEEEKDDLTVKPIIPPPSNITITTTTTTINNNTPPIATTLNEKESYEVMTINKKKKEEKKFYDDLEIVVPEKEEPQPPNTIRERTKEEEFLHWKKRNGFS